jgi:low temperature requirement protein LtrA
MAKTENKGLLRDRTQETRVTFVELFFDLVFVFAITQLSHHLLEHLTFKGAAQTMLLLLGVWWVWVATTWATNWADPDRTPVRAMLIGLMMAGLLLSVSLPHAFGDGGLVFAVAYVVMQVGRTLFMTLVMRGHSKANYRNFWRITIWLCLSGVFWVAGAFVEEELRFALWALALLIEIASPAFGFYLPGLGRSTTSEWDLDGGHMAERCGLFIIICLGESILITGATYARLAPTPETTAAFFVSFIGSVAMWWLYFDIGAERASRLIEEAHDPGRIARAAYTYAPIIIVAGIVVSAVSDELILAHPTGHTEAPAAWAILGGPALFLAGNLVFKFITAGTPPLSHMAGLALLALIALFGLWLEPVMMAGVATFALIFTAVWERISLRNVRQRLTE